MKTDTLNRRTREKRQPKKDRNYAIQERDIRWLSFLHRHGGKLPTSYLYDFTKATHRDKNYSQERLMELYQELQLLDRPWQQFEVRDSRCNELVHEISPKGIEVLKEHGLYSPNAPTMGGHFKHQLYLSCVSASIELNARDNGIGYIPQHEVLDYAGKPLEFDLSSGKFVPDGVFVLVIDGKKVLCFLEIDRSTEGNYHVASLKGKRWEKSLSQYDDLILGKHYKDHLKADMGALLLVVTVSQDKQEKILKIVGEKHPNGCSYVMSHYYPQFGKLFHPPERLDVLGATWKRSGKPDFKFI